jgi:hypothetical protein
LRTPGLRQLSAFSPKPANVPLKSERFKSSSEEDDFVVDGVNIKIIPAWKWLLFTEV